MGTEGRGKRGERRGGRRGMPLEGRDGSERISSGHE